MRLSNIVMIAGGLVAVAALFLENESRYSPSVKVSKGKLDSGIAYMVQDSPSRRLVISFPGARISAYTGSLGKLEFGIDYLQDDVKTADGKDISRDEVFHDRTILYDGEKDGNQSRRDYWKAHSIPNTPLREEIIEMGNEVARRENLHRAFRDGSPDLTTAYEREQKSRDKLGVSK